MDLVKLVYKLTMEFPREELFGIVAQMRRCAVSIPSNIAEGYGRLYAKETVRFLSVALGSASELETQLILSKEQGFASGAYIDELVDLDNEIIRIVSTLMKNKLEAIDCNSLK